MWFLLAGCGPATKPADLILTNGTIVTLDETKPKVQALAARGDTIVAIGTDREIAAYRGPKTRVIDLEGRLAIPGFIEGHGHLTSLGRSKLILDLTRTRNWDEVVAMVREAAAGAKPGEPILGRGWHQEKWDRTPAPSVEGFPTHASLSAVAPHNPVLLTHASGHATFVNAKALEIAGIGRTTPDPPGGEILKDSAGNPTGLLRETASRLVQDKLAETLAGRASAEAEAATRKEIELAIQECLSKGITSFQDAGSSFETIDLLRKMAGEGQLGLRLYVMIREDNPRLAPRLADYKIIGEGNEHLTVRAIKRAIDGALGSRGAWLLEPYSDLPTSTGLNTTPLDEMRETARLAVENDFQLCVHAIGDRGNRETLDLYQEILRAHPEKRELRWRIEHAQHLAAADIPRFGSLGVIASMQGIHCTSDAPFVTPRLGAKRAAEGAYVWRKLMTSGAVVSNGTDAPVEDVSPIACFYASVTRRGKSGEAFYPDQRMTRMEALRSYTLDAAFAAFEERRKGSLSPGKLADVTVLSRDILTVPEEQIPSAEVVYTIVGGNIAYQK